MGGNMKVHLTTERVANYQYEGTGTQSFLWDDKLSGFGVRATKPTNRNPSGSKSYIFQGRFNDDTFRITIGGTNESTLGDAKAEANLFITQMNNGRGRDPRDVIKEDKAKKKAKKEAIATAKRDKELEGRLTLRALCNAYCDGLKAQGKHKSATDTLSAFNCHVFTTDFADLPAKEITSKNISQIIRKVFESGKERTAGILRNYLVATYNSARKAPFDPKALSTLITFDITSNPAEIIATIPVKRGERYLSAEELKAYLSALGESPVDFLLKLHLYSGGQRIAQLSRAKVADYQPETGTLRLLDPKGKRATPREHFIPLAPKAIEIIKSICEGDGRLFKSNEREAGARVTEISKSMGKKSFDMRDLRRTCETMLVGMGISKDIRAQLLSHGIGGVQDAHYDRHGYVSEKHNALVAWESRLDEIMTGKATQSNVTDIKKVAA
jgi:integrase